MADPEQQGVSTPGQLLRSARQLHGWSIEEVAAELNLLSSIVQALENDDYQDLAGRTYVVGYLRSYGKLASVNVDGAIEGHTALMPPLQDGPGTMTEDLVRGQPVAIHYRWVVTALVLVLVVGGLYGAYLKRSDDVEKIPLTASKKTEPIAELVREPLPQKEPASAESEKALASSQVVSGSDTTGSVAQIADDKALSGGPTSDQQGAVPGSVTQITAVSTPSSESGSGLTVGSSGLVTEPTAVASDSTVRKETEPVPETVPVPRLQTEPQTKIQYPSKQRSESAAREIVTSNFIKTRFLDLISASGGKVVAPPSSVSSQPAVEEVKITKITSAPSNDRDARRKVVLVPDRELTILVNESSQVIIWDGDGVQLFRKYLNAGKVVTVSGIPPFDVQLQSAEGVRIIYAGKQFDFPVPKSGRNARFLVGAEE